MKMRTLIAGNVAVLVLVGLSLQAAEPAKFFARSGSKLRIEGTSNIHDWRVESTLIGGSIEAGKIANLVVTNGDIFSDRTQVKWVFVDGRKFEVKETAPPPGGPPGGGQRPGAAVNMTGKWHIQAKENFAFDTTRHVRPGMPGPTNLAIAYNRPLPGQPIPCSIRNGRQYIN